MGKGKKIKINWIRFAVTALILVVIIAIIVSIINIISLHLKNRELVREQSDLVTQKERLQKEFENVNDLDYIEEQARKQLRMVKPGEQIYIIDDSTANPDEKENKELDEIREKAKQDAAGNHEDENGYVEGGNGEAPIDQGQ